MKQCPRCNRNYADEALSYCLEDGAVLVKKYDPEATLINPNPPAPVVPPTVAYPGTPVTTPMQTPGPAPAVPAPTARRRSPWAVGALVLVALAVSLTIGGFIFQRSNTPSSASPSLEPEQDPVATHTTTPTPVSSTSTPTPVRVEEASPSSTIEQSTPVHEPDCVLYNDKSDKSVIRVRENCDTQNCESDASTIAGEYPDNTAIRVIKGSNVQTARFTWVKVIIAGSGRTVWVASSKIKCA